MRRSSTSRHRSLRAVRRDITVLAVAATASISLGTWLHAQRCTHDEPVQVVCVEACQPAPSPTPASSSEPGCEEPVAQAEPQAELEPPVARALEYGAAFSFVMQLDRPYVVLATKVDPAWAKGEPELDDAVNAWRSVRVDALPQALRDTRGGVVTLYASTEGKTRQVHQHATIGAPRLLSRAEGELYDGHEVVADTWQIHAQLEGGSLSESRAKAVAKALWDLGEQVLVAPLEGEGLEALAPGAWARSASLPAPTFYAQAFVGAEDEAMLQSRLLATKEGQESAKDFERFESGPLSASLSTSGWVDPMGRLALATTFVDSPNVGICGGLDILVSNAARVRAGAIGTPHNLPVSHTGGPMLVADLNLDGYPDIVVASEEVASSDVVLAGGPNGHVIVESLHAAPYFGCPC